MIDITSYFNNFFLTRFCCSIIICVASWRHSFLFQFPFWYRYDIFSSPLEYKKWMISWLKNKNDTLLILYRMHVSELERSFQCDVSAVLITDCIKETLCSSKFERNSISIRFSPNRIIPANLKTKKSVWEFLRMKLDRKRGNPYFTHD